MLRYIFFFAALNLVLADTLPCALCEKAAVILKNKTDIITQDLLNLCKKLNSTAHRLECNAAVKTIISVISGETPEQMCEKVKLCNGTDITPLSLATDLVELEMPTAISLRAPKIDLCPLCEKAASILKNNTDNIATKLLQVCTKLNTTAKRLECKAAVETVVKLINGETAEQLCQKIKLCNSTEEIDIDRFSRLADLAVPLPFLVTAQPEEPEFDLCPLCEKVVGSVQSHSQEIQTFLNNVCSKLNSTVEKIACKTAVAEAMNVLNSQTSNQICAEAKLCSNSTQIGSFCNTCIKSFKLARANPELLSSLDCASPTCKLMKWKGQNMLENSELPPNVACENLGVCPHGWVSGVW